MSAGGAQLQASQQPDWLGEPLHRLYAAPDLPEGSLPEPLRDDYGSDLGVAACCLYGNFVSSLDGVVALGPEYPSSGSAISGREPADRFVMALLRSLADAVLIGAGTLRATPTHDWTAEHVWPAGTDAFTVLRRRQHRRARPLLVVVTSHGDLPVDHPALQQPTLVVTTGTGRDRLAGRLPSTVELAVLADSGAISLPRVVDLLHGRRCARLLTEGGPNLLGQLVATRLLNELFVTLGPHLAGRGDTPRPGLISELELLPARRIGGELASVHRHGSYLFLRYRFLHSRADDRHDSNE